jgi:hypothetical protein
MKRQSETQGEGSFADKMRERLTRGTEAARRMINRVRELVEQERAQATATPVAPPAATVTPPAGAAPQHGGAETWAPTRPEERAAKPAPRKRAAKKPAAAPRPSAAVPAPAGEQAEPVEIAPTFATTTMGTILLQQGRVQEALAVFERAVAKNPEDSVAQRGLEQARAALGMHPASAAGEQLEAAEEDLEAAEEREAPEPASMLDRAPPPFSYGISEARALPVDPTTIVVFWEMTDDAVAEAGCATGWGATRSLYIVSLLRGPRGVRRVERYVDDVAQTGDYFVPNVPAGAIHHAAVGLRRGERFVPVAHAAPVATPRGVPSEEVARVRGTVALPPRAEGAEAQSPRIVHVSGPSEAVEELVAAHPASALADGEHGITEPQPAQPAFGARPTAEEEIGPEDMPSSADLARRRGVPGGETDAVPSSGQWTSSGQWPRRG